MYSMQQKRFILAQKMSFLVTKRLLELIILSRVSMFICANQMQYNILTIDNNTTILTTMLLWQKQSICAFFASRSLLIFKDHFAKSDKCSPEEQHVDDWSMYGVRKLQQFFLQLLVNVRLMRHHLVASLVQNKKSVILRSQDHFDHKLNLTNPKKKPQWIGI